MQSDAWIFMGDHKPEARTFLGDHKLDAQTFFSDHKFYLSALTDTITELPVKTIQEITEVVQSPLEPQKERVQYLTQVTRYGFKNLFKNNGYNSALPYSSQVNPHAENYMQDYLRAHGNYLIKMRGPAQPYFNLIDNILVQYGLPKELKYLAVIESDLKPGATSWVGAKGPWQFMTYTAKDYGLQINGLVDERTDYNKSTHAAARYLLSLYKDLKDWLLVIAAYNGGLGRVYTAIRESGSRNFWNLQYYLPAESRNHVKKFIATHYIMEAGIEPGGSNYETGGMDLTGILSPKQILSETDINTTEVLNISGKYNSSIIAKNLLLEPGEFNRLNPGFDAVMSSGEAFDLRLPSSKMDLFIANKYPILNECVEGLLHSESQPVKTSYKRRAK